MHNNTLLLATSFNLHTLMYGPSYKLSLAHHHNSTKISLLCFMGQILIQTSSNKNPQLCVLSHTPLGLLNHLIDITKIDAYINIESVDVVEIFDSCHTQKIEQMHTHAINFLELFLTTSIFQVKKSSCAGSKTFHKPLYYASNLVDKP